MSKSLNRGGDDGVVTALPGITAAFQSVAPAERRPWAVIVAGLASLLWLGACAFYAIRVMNPAMLEIAEPLVATGLVSGVFLPLMAIWMAALALQRMNPLARNRVLVQRGLEGLLDPVALAETRIGTLVAKIGRQSQELQGSADLAAAKISELERTLARQIEELLRVTAQAESGAEQAGAALARERSALHAAIADGSAQAETIGAALAEVRVHIGETLATAGGHADQLYQMSESATRLQQTLNQVFTALEQQRTVIGETADRVTAQTATIETGLAAQSAQAQAAAAQLAEAGRQAEHSAARFVNQAENLSEQALGHAARLERQITALEGAGQTMTQQIEAAADAVSRAGNTLESQNDAVLAVSAAATDRLDQTSQAIARQQAALDQLMATAGEQTDVVADRMRRHVESLSSLLIGATADLTAAIDGLTAHYGVIDQSGQSTREGLVQASNDLLGQAGRLTAEGGTLARQIVEAGAQLGDEQGRLAEGARIALDNLTTASDALRARAAEAATITDHAALKLQAIEAGISGGVGKVGEAASRAQAAADLVSTALESEALNLMMIADKTAEKARALGDLAQTTLRDEFIKTSSALIESLNSAAIDISRLMSTDVPDEHWDRYLRGERGLFTRLAVTIGTRKPRTAIAQLYQNDADFRAAARKFIDDFQSLMGRVMDNDPKSALSVTLLSSDMGKLYVLLTRAVKQAA